MCKKCYSKEKSYRIYDLQAETYSNYTNIEALYTMLLESYCECGEGYDVLDETDGQMKCLNCYGLNHLNDTSIDKMVDMINSYEFEIEEEIEE